VWVVASDETVRRWCAALTQSGAHPVPLPWCEVAAPDEPDAVLAALDPSIDLVLFTSANALRFFDAVVDRLPAACVGNATAEAARRAGFSVEFVGHGGAEDLAQEVVRRFPSARRILFVRGREAREEGVEALREAGVEVRSVVAYQTRPRPSFVSEVREAPAPDAILVGSPLAAGALLDALDAASLWAPRDTLTVAVGETTAARLRALGFPRVRVADRAEPGALIEALEDPP
jgi:uroporphyrinogen-III synthase